MKRDIIPQREGSVMGQEDSQGCKAERPRRSQPRSWAGQAPWVLLFSPAVTRRRAHVTVIKYSFWAYAVLFKV
jgi:hypothetical protein